MYKILVYTHSGEQLTTLRLQRLPIAGDYLKIGHAYKVGAVVFVFGECRVILEETRVSSVVSVVAEHKGETTFERHQFVGREDRWCEVCNRPDRDIVHKHLNERMIL